MSPELKEAITTMTQHVDSMRVLKNYFDSDATSYEKQKENVIELKRLNKKVKELL